MQVKMFVKQLIPWRLRYLIKLWEAQGKILLPLFLKQQSSAEEYSDSFYNMLEAIGVDNIAGKTVCEMGPGQFLANAFLEYQMGAKREILLEIVDFANMNAPADREGFLLRDGYPKVRSLPEMDAEETRGSYLSKINAFYSTSGIAGYQEVASNEVDCVFSIAVLEHIRKKEFVKTLQEVYRFMRAGGVACHQIDFRDHLGGRKNHLRFPSSVWEDDVHYKMDNYTNRLSCTEMVHMMENVGFKAIKVERQMHRSCPIQRKDLAVEFVDISDEDLMTAGALIIAKK